MVGMKEVFIISFYIKRHCIPGSCQRQPQSLQHPIPPNLHKPFFLAKKKCLFFFFLLKKPILYIFEILLPVYTDSNSLLKDIFWAKTGIYKITIPTALDPGNQRPYALPQKVTRMVTWESGTVQVCPFI